MRQTIRTHFGSRDGHGTILRLIDLGGASRVITIEAPPVALSKVLRTDAVETARAAADDPTHQQGECGQGDAAIGPMRKIHTLLIVMFWRFLSVDGWQGQVWRF